MTTLPKYLKFLKDLLEDEEGHYVSQLFAEECRRTLPSLLRGFCIMKEALECIQDYEGWVLQPDASKSCAMRFIASEVLKKIESKCSDVSNETIKKEE